MGSEINALLTGFVAVAWSLIEKGGIVPLLQDRIAPLRQWFSRRGKRKDDEKALSEAIASALDEAESLLAPKTVTRIRHYLCGDLAPDLARSLAAMTVDAVGDKCQETAQQFATLMNLPASDGNGAGKFLVSLRRHLGQKQGFRDIISTANEFHSLGLEYDIAKAVTEISNTTLQIARVVEQLLATIERDADVSETFAIALRSYFHTLRTDLTMAILPFKPGSGQDKLEAPINEIFVPVSVKESETTKPPTKHRIASAGQPPEESKALGAPVSSNIVEPDDGLFGTLLSCDKAVVVLGKPGAGKTTLLRFTALAFAEGRLSDVPGWGSQSEMVAFPILFRLGGFAKFLDENRATFSEPCSGSIVAYLTHHYSTHKRVAIPPNFFDSLLLGGGCAIFMDGLDEVSSTRESSTRELVAQHVCEFIRHYKNKAIPSSLETDKNISQQLDRSVEARRTNYFALSCRPKGFEAVASHFLDLNLRLCEVQPLKRAGIRQLTLNVLRVVESNVDHAREDHIRLTEAIFGNAKLMDLASNPLFCTSLVLVYLRGCALPTRRVDVFEEIVELMQGLWAKRDRKPENDPISVEKKTKILAEIAFQMQLLGKRDAIEYQEVLRIVQRFFVDVDGESEKEARTKADDFLLSAQERSGLIAEIEGVEPRLYAFGHQQIREYLVAFYMANEREQSFLKLLMSHMDDVEWDEIILLAASHSRHKDGDREFILQECIKAADECKREGKKAAWARRLFVAGRMSRDMGDLLPVPQRRHLRNILENAARDVTNEISYRCEAALILDDLDWLADDLYCSVPIGLRTSTSELFVGKHMVSNQQYRRFIDSEEFFDLHLWRDCEAIEIDRHSISIDDESRTWLVRHEGDERFPAHWNDPKFGIAHRGTPVVGISWYEASAYCRWLKERWPSLEEAAANPTLRPKRIRLLTEWEWLHAVGASNEVGSVVKSYPWHKDFGEEVLEARDINNFANVGSLDRTTPCGMFEKGISLPFGLVDACGNAWEWQANYSDRSNLAMSIRGGSYRSKAEDARCFVRGWSDPQRRVSDIGFRVLIEC